MQERTRGIRDLTDEALHAELLREAGRLTRNAADAKDLVQDTLERGMRKVDLHTHGALRPWLLHIMRNLFIDRCRRRRPTESGVELLPIAAAAQVFPRWALVSDEALAGAIDALDPHLRDVFVLKEQEGHTYLQIARRLNIPAATVGTRLLRARRRLRAILTEQSPELSDDGATEDSDVQLQ
jgi:RNA polymerase sigma-70 factor (ECF subfamily)